MKTVIGAAVIVAALVPWQPNAHATTMVATDVEGQPLTRAACDKAGLEWNDNRNICNWEPTQQLASELITGAIAEIASKPQRATKQSTRVNNHTKREYTHTRQTQVVKSRPFPLFRLFRD